MYEEHQVKRSIGFFLQKPKVWGKSSLQIVSSLQRSLQSSVWGKGILVMVQVSIQSESCSWHYRDDSFFTDQCKSYPLSRALWFCYCHRVMTYYLHVIILLVSIIWSADMHSSHFWNCLWFCPI